ncbi:SRPBCC family protein [Tessaracoccus coleopterorum]|nr:hypothetical protein [Tessaracoccus coleopterorum]
MSIVIGRGAGEVYEYMADVDNLPAGPPGSRTAPSPATATPC